MTYEWKYQMVEHDAQEAPRFESIECILANNESTVETIVGSADEAAEINETIGLFIQALRAFKILPTRWKHSYREVRQMLKIMTDCARMYPSDKLSKYGDTILQRFHEEGL